ncbi:MAG: chemotaxis protein CheW [Proteobacteria bacterium]|nr:MAG: chemotaxis protein CheW [Pseudomonadota bacterium]
MAKVFSLNRATEAEGGDIISGLLLPIADMDLLLPNVSVAEVVDYQTPEPDPAKPDWLLGTVFWRGQALPVVSFEVMNGGSRAAPGENPRLIVINSIGVHHKEIPFFALVTRSIPRLIKIDYENIAEEEKEKGPAEKMKVMTQGEPATIPDMDYLEKLLYEVI